MTPLNRIFPVGGRRLKVWGGLLGGLIAIGFPTVICWTFAVLAARGVRDLPITKRVVADVLLTGCQLLLIWLLLSIPAGIVLFLNLLALAVGSASQSSAASVPLVVFLGTTWFWFRPAVRDEWERLAR